MAFTPNCKKVFEIMYFNRKINPDGWMRIDTIRRLCDFEKAAPVVGSLIALQRAGLVEKIQQTLLDGNTFNFFRAICPLPSNIEIDFSVDIKIKEE